MFLKVLGGSAPILREIELSWANVNHGDTFVLDAGDIIFIWSGHSSSGMEKMKAAALANKLRDRVGEDIVPRPFHEVAKERGEGGVGDPETAAFILSNPARWA